MSFYMVPIEPSPLIALGLVHLLAVASPGPDFALVTRNSLKGSVKAGMATAFGIATGNGIHILIFSLSSIWLSNEHASFFNGIKVCGGLYLILMGLAGVRGYFRSRNVSSIRIIDESESQQGEALTLRKSYLSGLFTTGLNAKAAVYFLTMVTQFVSGHQSGLRNLAMVLLLLSISFIWFSLISMMIGSAQVRSYLGKKLNLVDGIMAMVLILFGVGILYRA